MTDKVLITIIICTTILAGIIISGIISVTKEKEFYKSLEEDDKNGR